MRTIGRLVFDLSPMHCLFPTKRLPICLVLIVSLILGGIAPGKSANAESSQQADSTRDTVILLDITASMRGLGTDPKARDIWDQVVENVVKQIEQTANGGALAIVPFDAGPRYDAIWPSPAEGSRDSVKFKTMNEVARQQAINHVRGLEPDGQSTWVCDSMDYALRQLKSLRTGGTKRDQVVYLYTDGADNGRCSENFAGQLVDTFNGQTQDYPYLSAVYIDLNDHLTNQDRQELEANTSGGVNVARCIPPIVRLNVVEVPLGNLADRPQQAEVQIRMTLPEGADPSWTASVQVEPQGLKVSPSTVRLDSKVELAVASVESFGPGKYSGSLRLTPQNGCYVFSNGGVVGLSFAWTPPTPTPPPTATPTSTPTPTPRPTNTPTPIPTPTHTPTPRPTNTPIPTPTATPTPPAHIVARIDRPDADLGSVVGGSGTPLTGTFPLLLTFDDAARRQDASAEVSALLDGKEQPEQFWIVRPGGGQAARGTIGPDENRVTVGYRLDAGSGRFWPGSETRSAEVLVTSKNAVVQTFAAGGVSKENLVFSYQISYPFGPLHIVMILALLALLALLLFILFHSRFPKDAEVVVQGGDSYALRSLGERGLKAKLFGSSVSIGGYGDDINVETDATIARLSPRRFPFSLFQRQVLLTPTEEFEEASLKIDGQPITMTQELYPDTTVTTAGKPMTYTARGDGEERDGYGDYDDYFTEQS